MLPGLERHPHARAVLRLDAPSHAYLFHGPAGAGKREVARAFAAELLADGAADPDSARARALRGAHPDLTLLLRVDPAAGRARQAGRGEAPDRLEREEDAFFGRIAAAYDGLAAGEPERFRVLDAMRPPDEVLDDALEAIRGLA